jgi:hypothetical protein
MLSIIYLLYRYKKRLNAIPETTAKATRTAMTFTAERPIFFANTVSTRRLWQNESIMAKIVISLMDRAREAIAPMAAYKFTTLPMTNTIAASPGRPNKPIRGANRIEIQSIIGVCFKKVTMK